MGVAAMGVAAPLAPVAWSPPPKGPVSSLRLLDQCCALPSLTRPHAVQSKFSRMAHSKCPYLSGTMSTSSSSSSIQDCHLLHEDACGTTSGTTISISSDGDDSSMMMSPSSSTSSLQEEACVQQAWQLKRPVLQHDVKLTRRQLRCLNRTWTLDDVAQHRFVDDGWIAVDGKVYDITEHVVSHPGWDTGCSVSTVLSIIAHLGTECSQEFREIHAPYPVAWNQLRAFYIGNLEQQPTAAASGVDE